MTRRTLRTSCAARRAPLAVVGVLAATAALSACSGDTDPGQATDQSDDTLAECQPADPPGSFEYTDARDQSVQLDTVPNTVVAQSSVAAGLWDAGYQVDAVFGELGDDPGSTYQRGNLDLDQVTPLGNTWGEFDLDAYGQLDPDLVIDYSFGGALWYVPSKQEKAIAKLAPIIGINGQPEGIDEAIEMFVDLAAKLGTDTTCNEELIAAKADYEEAVAAINENERDLNVLVASASDTSFWVVNPAALPETQTLVAAGVDLMGPEKPTDVFTELSWEQAADFAEADVILMDGRNTEAVKEKLKTIDTWANLPAVKAGQVYTWYAGAAYSYQEYARIFGELADQLAGAEDLG